MVKSIRFWAETFGLATSRRGRTCLTGFASRLLDPDSPAAIRTSSHTTRFGASIGCPPRTATRCMGRRLPRHARPRDHEGAPSRRPSPPGPPRFAAESRPAQPRTTSTSSSAPTLPPAVSTVAVDDLLASPFQELALVTTGTRAGQPVVGFSHGPKPTLTTAAFAFAVRDFWRCAAPASESISLRSLMLGYCAPGSVFLLDEVGLYDHAERLCSGSDDLTLAPDGAGGFTLTCDAGPVGRTRSSRLAGMTSPIATRLSIERRYVRSVDIPRDLDDPEALDGYILTPSARDAAVRITEALTPASRQRAFRLVGAYGSGKSAFGLFLARLLRERGRGPATRLLAAALPELPPPPHWQSIVLHRPTRQLRQRTPSRRINNPLRPSSSPTHSPTEPDRCLAQGSAPDPLAVTALLVDVANDLRARTGAGLLLIVDEMGRFLEHAAANASVEDPSIFQALAEQSGGRSGANLAVVGILHHGFADYVAGLGAWIEAEWARFSARYEEIRFDNSTEQSLFLLAQALVHAPPPRNGSPPARPADVRRGARPRHIHHEAPTARGHRPKVSIPFIQRPSRQSPLPRAASAKTSGRSSASSTRSNPTVSSASSARRRTTSENWYRTPNVFDHLAATIADNPTNARQRRWSLALDAMTIAADLSVVPSGHVLKTVALFAVLEPVPGLVADVETIAWCLQRSCRQGLIDAQRPFRHAD